jgi:hypothetical protein
VASIIEYGHVIPGGTNVPSLKYVDSPPADSPFLQPSLIRKVGRIFYSVISLLRTCFMSNKPIYPRLADAFPNLSDKGLVYKLNSRRYLDDRILTYLKGRISSEKNVQVFTEYVALESSDDILFRENKRFIAVPVALKGPNADHVVCFYIDLDLHTVEYFDSRGLSILDLPNTPLDLPNTTANQTLLEFANKLIADSQEHCKRSNRGGNCPWKVFENTQRMQFDAHNCAIYAYHFFKSRIKGKTWVEIQNKPLSFDEANTGQRKKILKELDQAALEKKTLARNK